MPASAHTYLLSLEQLGIKLGLEQIRALVARLGEPDRAFRSIVVAGTNGKGSTTAMVERGLRAAGYRTGRYTSPHLIHLEERFVLNGQPIGSEAFTAAAERVRAAAAHLPAPPSFFEATTALALDAFREAMIEIAVLEVGLGGRLDATNVVSPMGVAITAIDLDHEQYLGDTLEAIATEKAGIIKPGVVAVLGRNPEAVRRLIRGRCEAVGAAFDFAPDGVAADAQVRNGRTSVRLRTAHADYGTIALALRGRHQVDNAVTAVRLLEALEARGEIKVPADAVRTALEDVDWPARLERRTWRGAEILIDGAHNPARARALASYISETYDRRLPFVLGVMNDKRIQHIVEAIAPVASCVICTAASSPRAEPARQLAAIARLAAADLDVLAIDRPVDALAEALRRGERKSRDTFGDNAPRGPRDRVRRRRAVVACPGARAGQPVVVLQGLAHGQGGVRRQSGRRRAQRVRMEVRRVGQDRLRRHDDRCR